MSWQNSSDVEAEGSVAARAAARNRMDNVRGWEERALACARGRIRMEQQTTTQEQSATDTQALVAFKPIKVKRKPSNVGDRDALTGIPSQCAALGIHHTAIFEVN